jgi:outer membrane receptor protein involved in Fe transport
VGTPNTLTGNTRIAGESYLRGYFGRANYKMFDKYLVGASIRRDGISKFTPENRWATFMSGSLGWIISEEKFFTFKPVSLLKLRGSFGQTGNTNIPSGITTDSGSITSGTNTLEGNNNTVLESIGNSDIKWETTNSLDFGIDFGLFSNRVNGSLAYYEQKVSDMLLAVTLPPSAGIRGGNSCWQNIGDMKNQGVEFNMDAVLVSKKDFTWSAGFNISTNKNEVLALDAESDAKGVGILQEGEGGVVRTITKTGLAYATWYLAEYAGVDAQKGIPMIYQVETLADGTTRHTGNIIPATVENITNNRMILEGKTACLKC